MVKKQLFKNEKYPVFQNSSTPLGWFNKYNYAGNTTFIIGAGAAGKVGYSYDDFWAADDCFCLVCKDGVNSRYIYHALAAQQDYIFTKIRKASIPRIGRDVVSSLKIPLPSITEQKRIVSILDKFDILTTSFTEGLPKEIESRKKQFEYYRDMLLLFLDKRSCIKAHDPV